MASQSLPPPPLNCSTPPPIDFGPPDDDEDPFPEEDDEPSEELPSFGDDDDAIPVPGDSFYLSSPPPKAVTEAARAVATTQLVNNSSSRPTETMHIDSVDVERGTPEVEDVMMNGSKQESDTSHHVFSSIHDLLNNHPHQAEKDEKEHHERVAPEPVSVVPMESEESATIDAESPSGKARPQEVEMELDNPPSLNFDVSPVHLERPEDVGVFSEALIRDCVEQRMSPLGESFATEQRKLFVEEQKSPADDLIDTENIPKTPDAEDNDAFGDFVDNEAVAEGAVQTNREHPKPETCDLEEDEIPISSQSVDEDDDFDAFTEFASAARTLDIGRTRTAEDVPAAGVVVVGAVAAADVIEPKGENAAFEADFNQFANFDNFTQSEGEKQNNQEAIGTAKETTIVGSGDVEEEEDDDDDFGDFTSSVPAPHFQEASTAVLPVAQLEDKLPPIDISNVGTVLMDMFPSDESVIGHGSSSQAHTAAAKILIATSAYETTALTNEYHWSKSHSNKCLVKCLGIDTRNILHGTKWNSEMPRFAANLGFSPLQPMKPTTTVASGGEGGGILKPTPAAAATAVSTGLPGGVGDVPAAQFDWDSSGLVNPLHASQAHTYLLDLEQLKVVVVASLENTKTTTASHTTTPAATASDAPPHRHAATGWSSAILLLPDTTGHTLSHGQGLLSGKEQEEEEEDLRLYEEYASFRGRTEMVAVEVGGREWRGGKESKERQAAAEQQITAQELASELNIRSVGDGEEAAKEEMEEEFVVATPTPPIAGSSGGGAAAAAGEEYLNPISEGQPPFMSPLRETHIFTPTKGGALPESRETNTAPAVGGVLPSTDAASATASEGIAVKEYRDVEYDPSKFLVAGVLGRAPEENDFGEFMGTQGEKSAVESHFSIAAPEEGNEDDDDDFSDFQSVATTPSVTTSSLTPPGGASIKTTGKGSVATNNPLAVLSVSGLSTMVGGRQKESAAQDNHILMPSILMPRPANAAQVGSGGGVFMNAESIRWPDQSEHIAQSELQRIEQMFAGHRGASQKAAVINQGAKPEQQEEDEWSDFVSVQGGVMSPQRSPAVGGGAKKEPPSQKVGATNEDDWTDFVSSAPSTGPNFTPWGASSNTYGQFIQPPIPSRPTTHLPPPRFGGGAPEMQFVDPSPFFISSTAAGLQSVFGSSQGAKKSNSGGKK